MGLPVTLVLSVLLIFILGESGFNVTSDNEKTTERIDINYRDNYVMISTPVHQQAQPVGLLHDYTEV